ncbi:MAG: putative quinol monooxygenase [Paracoccaceae bacterium]
MIVVAGHIDVDPANEAKVDPVARTMMEETRGEAGCRVYDITRSLETLGRLHVYEEWDDLAALEAHFDTPHMKTWREALAALGVLGRQIARMEAGEPTAL